MWLFNGILIFLDRSLIVSNLRLTIYNKAAVGHNILIHHLENWVGLFGTVFSFPPSYITDKKILISCGDHVLETSDISCGVTQGSCAIPFFSH